jgi:hypothetical protein
VIQPEPDELEKQEDGGLLGKHAFIMRMEEVGSKGLPHVKTAPVIYVCHNPYDYGTKAELNAKFQMINMKTGKNFMPPKWGDSERDMKPTFWDALNVVRSRKPVQEKLGACAAAGDFFPEIIHMSYLNKEKADLDRMSMAADCFSIADIWGWNVHPDIADVMRIIYPANYMLLSSKDLLFQKPKLAEKDKLRPEKAPTKKRASTKKGGPAPKKVKAATNK